MKPKLADFMMRDPFDRPFLDVDVSDDSRTAKIIRSLFPLGAPGYDAVFFSQRASTPKCVIDSSPDWSCARCGEAVWVSPSSKRAAADSKFLIVCTHCFAEGAARQMKSGDTLGPSQASEIATNTRRLFESLDAAVEQKTKAMGVTCRKGCAHCCYLLAVITFPDAIVLADHLLNRPDWEAWLPRLRESSERADYEGICFDNYFDKRIPCVFLDGGNTCRVYSARPSQCRYHVVTSDPVECSHFAPTGRITQIDMTQLELMVAFSALVADPETGTPICGPIPLMTLFAMGILAEGSARQEAIERASAGLPNPIEWTRRHAARIGAERKRQVGSIFR